MSIKIVSNSWSPISVVTKNRNSLIVYCCFIISQNVMNFLNADALQLVVQHIVCFFLCNFFFQPICTNYANSGTCIVTYIAGCFSLSPLLQQFRP
jgi:hypothetical protein